MNSSAYLDEIRRVQSKPKFSEQDLQNQRTQIKKMQDSGKYDHIFIGS
jgi:hypothetical protein